MGGRASKRKGSRVEREIVNLHKEDGIEASRVPLSGAAGGIFSGDIKIGDDFVAEVKSRKGGAGFKTIESWLGDCDLIFLKRDRASPFVVMPWETYSMLIKAFMEKK